MTEFKYAPMFQLGKDETEYRLISKEGITVAKFEGKEINLSEKEVKFIALGFSRWIKRKYERKVDEENQTVEIRDFRSTKQLPVF